MKFTSLLAPWIKQEISDCVVSGIQNDSRLIQPGDLFLAYPGAVCDGRLFVQKALLAGAVAVAYDPLDVPASCTLPKDLPCLAVPQLAEQLAAIAQRFYGQPSASLSLTGVTGTNGKTSIAYQLAQAHLLLGKSSAYVGTLGQGEVHHLQPLENTTPDALCLQRLLALYKKQNIQEVCMEVSSHALSQHRVKGIEFKQALFTNLTQDHLDYHRTMQAYAAAKALLFGIDSLQWAIINQDDTYQQTMSQALVGHVKKISYGLNEGSDVRALDWQMDLRGTHIQLSSPWGSYRLETQALGAFNVYNSLAIFSSLLVSGYTPEQVVWVMSQLKAAPGRMEIVAQAPLVLVDYAHTPDALEKALVTLGQLKKGFLWVVFGCGGDRDQTKRPLMGKVASLYADKIVITSDNPRNEDPGLILEEIAAGIENSKPMLQLVHREEAIAYALEQADKDDIILIAGKGHETYQQIGSVKQAFSDQEVVKRLF